MSLTSEQEWEILRAVHRKEKELLEQCWQIDWFLEAFQQPIYRGLAFICSQRLSDDHIHHMDSSIPGYNLRKKHDDLLKTGKLDNIKILTGLTIA